MNQKKKKRKMTNNERIAYLIIIIGLLCMAHCSHRKATDANDVIGALSDSLKQSYNKYGELQSSKRVIAADLATLKTLSESKDSIIRALAKEVSKKTILRGVVIQKITDTLFLDPVYPERAPCDTLQRIYQLKDKWGRFKITTHGGRAFLAYDITNASTLDISYRRPSLFKRAVPVITLTDHNPNSRTERMEFLMQKKAPIPWWGYAACAVGGFALGKL
jgi:hypothetical protein